MNSRISTVSGSPSYRLTLLCSVLVLNACTSQAALRDQERARYETLESELISAQAADERRQRSEYRVASKIQSLDATRSADAHADDKTHTEPASIQENDNDSIFPGNQTDGSSSAEDPLVAGQPELIGDGAVWTLQNYPSPVDGRPLCAAVSTPVVVRNGALDTNASIIATAEAVFLRTDATFDTKALETGYRVDAGFPITFDRFLNEVTAVVDDNLGRLVDAMRTGTTLSVRFAYAPQLSSADTHVMELDLDSFAQVWSRIRQCAQ